MAICGFARDQTLNDKSNAKSCYTEILIILQKTEFYLVEDISQ